MAIDYTLNDLETQLDSAKFFRANRQYIIGIDSIERINFLFDSKLSICLMSYPKLAIIVSKKKASQLKEWIDKWFVCWLIKYVNTTISSQKE